ncbi:MAG: DUF6491 family protein [Sphingopyxis sp.]|nr:DUF6491 family protein [Sphingopyxis sp.]
MRFASALALAAVPLALAAEEAPQREVGVEGEISFPALGGIRNFRADSDRGVWLEDRQRNWYYASFLGTCPEIRFAQGIGIDTRGSARFDKYSKILVRGNVCAIATLVTADKPLSEREQRKLRKQAEAELKAEAAAN